MIPLVSCQSDLNIRYVETISRIIAARSKRPTLASMALEAKSTGSDYCAADDKISPVVVVGAGEMLIG